MPRRGRRAQNRHLKDENAQQAPAKPSSFRRRKENFLALVVAAGAIFLIGRFQEVDQRRSVQASEYKRNADGGSSNTNQLLGTPLDHQRTAEVKTEPPSQSPTASQSKGPAFEGTKFTQISRGMDLFENVCIRRGHKIPNQILSFSADGKSIGSSSFKYMRPPNWALWTALTEGNHLDEWNRMIGDSQVALVENETLLALNIWSNPGHCLSDFAFSVALDAYDRRLQDQQGSMYPTYLYSYFKGLRTDQYAPDWCFEFMRRAGFIEPEKGLLQRSEQTICFKRLLVPMLVLYRFPVDWKDEDSLRSITAYPWGQEIPRGLDKNYAIYPQEAIQMLKDNVMKGSGLPGAPWQQDADTADTTNNVTILFYGREGVHSRSLENSKELVSELALKYHAKVDVVDQQQWNYLMSNVTAQMELFNHYSHIVTVHGAFQANQMFCRPNARIVEIVPGDLSRQPSLTAKYKNETKSSLEWYGQSGWFASFSRRVSQEHFVIGEPGYNMGSRVFTVNVTRMADFIATRFGLKKRELRPDATRVDASVREYAMHDLDMGDLMAVPEKA